MIRVYRRALTRSIKALRRRRGRQRLVSQLRDYRPSLETLEPRALLAVSPQDAFGGLPLAFEPNQGQTDSDVRYLSRGNGFTVYLTSTEAVMTLTSPAS